MNAEFIQMPSQKSYFFQITPNAGPALFIEEINRKINPQQVKYDVVTSYGKLMEIVGVNRK